MANEGVTEAEGVCVANENVEPGEELWLPRADGL